MMFRKSVPSANFDGPLRTGVPGVSPESLVLVYSVIIHYQIDIYVTYSLTHLPTS